MFIGCHNPVMQQTSGTESSSKKILIFFLLKDNHHSCSVLNQTSQVFFLHIWIRLSNLIIPICANIMTFKILLHDYQIHVRCIKEDTDRLDGRR